MPSEFVKDVLIVLITLLGGGMGIAYKDYKDKKKRKAELEAAELANEIKREELASAIERRLREDRDDLLKRIDQNNAYIAELEKMSSHRANENKKLIEQLTKDSEECRYQHQVTELVIAQLKKHNVFKDWHREFVYVVDDDQDVLEDFRHKFAKVDILEYRGFSRGKDFLEQARQYKPMMVVIDHHLGDRTAEDIIKDLGYEPEIFIMSGEQRYEARYKTKGIRFFLKDDHYVYKIAMAIVQYLTDKN